MLLLKMFADMQIGTAEFVLGSLKVPVHTAQLVISDPQQRIHTWHCCSKADNLVI